MYFTVMTIQQKKNRQEQKSTSAVGQINGETETKVEIGEGRGGKKEK